MDLILSHRDIAEKVPVHISFLNGCGICNCLFGFYWDFQVICLFKYLYSAFFPQDTLSVLWEGCGSGLFRTDGLLLH